MENMNIIGVVVPTKAIMHETPVNVFNQLVKNGGWDGNTRIKGMSLTTKEKLLEMKELFRTSATALPAVIKMSKYFGITRTIPEDMVKASSITGSVSKKNAKVRLRRVMISKDISIERRKVFCDAIAQAATMKCWGTRVVHNKQGSIVNLWWDGRVPSN